VGLYSLLDSYFRRFNMKVENIQIQVDIGPGEGGRITVALSLSDFEDGLPVTYEFRSYRDFESLGPEGALSLVEDHPLCRITHCESPIEVRFFAFAVLRLPDLRPQVVIGNYRADFALPNHKIAIEIDGHDYHKTREQRTHDARRERYLQLQGWRVIRFTGTEIFENVIACVEEVTKLVDVFISSDQEAWISHFAKVGGNS
jgi:very-short-patch-repair endonuclease